MSTAPKCDHPEAKYVYRVFSNGTKHHGKQCLKCGKWKAISKRLIPIQHMDVLTEYDNEMQNTWRQLISDWYTDQNEKRQAGFEKEQQEESAAWWTEYNAYLTSPDWQERRQKALERDSHTCQACLEKQATQVHHRTYQFGFAAPLFALVSICKDCHDKIHTKEW